MANYNISDPLAQSFFIEEPCVVTKVDLFFQAKDDNIPMIIQLRKNEAGVPGPYVLPFSTAVVYPASILTSSNANVATTVSFPSPVYVDPGEYSITLGSASKNYRVWVSELDTTDIVSNKRITEQPYVGALFKGQNASTYTPAQLEDLKFNLYRANFNTSVVGIVDFEIPQDDIPNTILPPNPLEVFPSSPIMRVYHPQHTLSTDSYVRLRGVANAFMWGNVQLVNNLFGIDGNNLVGPAFTVSNVTSDTYTVELAQSSTVTTATRFGGAAVVAEQDLKMDMIYPVIGAVKQAGTITPKFKATSTGYSIDSTYETLAEGDNELTVSKIIASNVNTEQNLANASSFSYRLEVSTDNRLVAPLIDKDQLGLVFARNLIDSPTYDSVTLQYDEVAVGTNASANVYQLSGNIGLLAFKDSAEIANAKSIVKGTQITIAGDNPNNGTFRVIDVLEDGANVKIYNLTGNGNVVTNTDTVYTVTNGTKFIFEEAATGGTAFSKYITRQIDFLNPSTSINLRIDVYNPPDATIEFYYKTKSVGETENLSNKEFTRLTDVTIPVSLTGEFFEVEKQIDSLEPFNSLILKIVFKSTNSAQAPKLKNLRAIVLE